MSDCGDSSCLCAEDLKGMRTNGGCHCDERALQAAVRRWKKRAQDAEEQLLMIQKADTAYFFQDGGWYSIVDMELDGKHDKTSKYFDATALLVKI